MTGTSDDWSAWIGRTETASDVAAAGPLSRWAATLDHEAGHSACEAALPPLAHWLYFLPDARQSELGADGHPVRGGFLPPVHDLPRRMWAGSRIDFPGEIRVGDRIERASRIASVKTKEGANGPLVFVTVRHEIACRGDAPAIIDEHDIVYRGDTSPAIKSSPQKAPAGEWRRSLVPDEILLFRYSALTFNGHRIHYDRSYATGKEGYPGLVVHGPLVATLLVDLVRRNAPRSRIERFSFRAHSPAIDGHQLNLNGEPPDEHGVARLWAATREGRLVMSSEATLS